MDKHNICESNFGASEELAAFAWKRPDGKVVDLCEVDLVDENDSDIFLRFFVHINHETQELISINPILIDYNANNNQMSDEDFSEEERLCVYNWAKNFLEANKKEIQNLSKED